jgi:hypothetical protein
MISPVTLLHVVLATSLLLNPMAAEKQSSARLRKTTLKPEPFRSFAILDAKLSVLTSQQASLQGALNGSGAGAHASAQSQTRSQLLNSMRIAIAQILRVTTRLQSRYARQHRSFGARIVGALRNRAKTVKHEIYRVQRAHTLSSARVADERLGNAIVALVLQFQAVSGGYATTQCATREWTCCEPKRPKDLMPGEEAACRWMCVPTARRCTGLLGPRISRDLR